MGQCPDMAVTAECCLILDDGTCWYLVKVVYSWRSWQQHQGSLCRILFHMLDCPLVSERDSYAQRAASDLLLHSACSLRLKQTYPLQQAHQEGQQISNSRQPLCGRTNGQTGFRRSLAPPRPPRRGVCMSACAWTAESEHLAWARPLGSVSLPRSRQPQVSDIDIHCPAAQR